MTSTPTEQPATAELLSAAQGFDHLFANRIDEARTTLSANDTPFHLIGLGVCAFLEAALGMEPALMAEASRCLTLAEAGAKKRIRLLKASQKSATAFPAGTEYEVLQADAVVLLGLTQALSETYRGYLQCLYSLNSAHSKYTALYKAVFPVGLETYKTPAASPGVSPTPSTVNLRKSTSSANLKAPTGFFGRWGGSSISLTIPTTPSAAIHPQSPLEEMIVSGTSFGYGMFNLVFSLLPAKVKSVAGFFGFQSDRKMALQALAVSAARKDTHAVFAGLTLMTYHGVVLLLAGWQADEAHIVKQYRAVVDKVDSQYPTGSLWILNRAKILRMTGDADGAIEVLQQGLNPGRPTLFMQADALLVFELAWTLLAQRRYEESADAFIKMTEMNAWSHATYYFIAAGCHISVKNYEKAQALLDKVPTLIDKKKIGGKDLPTEVFIKKKLVYYRRKHKRRTGSEEQFAESITISPADELGIFWNTHSRITRDVALAHIQSWTSLTPPVTLSLPFTKTPAADPEPNAVPLDTVDEFSLRSLVLGIVYRTVGEWETARALLSDVAQHEGLEGKWMLGVAMYELAVVDLWQTSEQEKVNPPAPDYEELDRMWKETLANASEKLEQALKLANTGDIDLSSRLDTRVAMLRDEIMLKKEMLERLSSGQRLAVPT